MKHEWRDGVDWHQLAVSHPSETYYNKWRKVDTSQGFAYRPVCVAFGTLTDSADCLLRVQTEAAVQVAAGAARVVVVPFTVPADGVLVGNLNNPRAVPIPAGRYELVFTAFPAGVEDEEEVYSFTFVPCDQPAARILLKDAELNPPDPLALDGEAATW